MRQVQVRKCRWRLTGGYRSRGEPSMRFSSVRYGSIDGRYFNRRSLRRYAGVWSLWALGVGAVISGNFFGWNFGLAAGGFGGLAVATAIVALMYFCMSLSIAEMAPAIPHTGGAYSFARTGLGSWAGFATGLAECIEYILTPAVIVVGIGGYIGSVVNSVFGMDVAAPVWWLIFYLVFIGINVAGVEAAFRAAVLLTILALGILAVFWVSAAFHFSWDMVLNIEPGLGNSRWLPLGWLGIAQAMPFAIWFYLAIEQIPLASEESRRPSRDIPEALKWGIITLIVASLLTLLLSSAVAPGAEGMGNSEEPLLLAFETIYGSGLGSTVLALAAVAGLVASFHAIIYAYGRRIYSLSRAGYLPRWLSLTQGGNQTPHLALMGGALVGYLVALLIEYGEEWFGAGVPVGAVLLNMAVFGAVIAYIMQMVSFVRLRQRYPGLYRPYVSPLGIAGATIAAVIACATLVFLFFNSDYRLGIFGCAIFFAGGLLYFALFSRRRLVHSPEESFALRLEEEGGGR